VQSENYLNRVTELLKRYGYQSQSYNILRSDKSYFFSPSGIDGVIAYVVHVRVAMAAGDPVCAMALLFSSDHRSLQDGPRKYGLRHN